MTLNSKQVLFSLILMLIYKNFFSLFIGGIVDILIVINILILFFIVSCDRNFYKVNMEKVLLIILIFLIIMYTGYSLSFYQMIISNVNILNSFRQFIMPIVLLYIIFTIDVNKLFLKKIILISLPLYVFALIELLIPNSIFQLFYDAFVGNTENFPTDSYVFWEFGFPIQRLGSLFFEPLTFGVFTAYLAITALHIKAERKYKLIIISLGMFSLIKTYYILVMSSILTNSKRGIFLYLLFIFLTMTGLIIFISQIPIEELRYIFFSVGPHFQGLVSGIFNSIDFPFGHGIGFSGYINEVANIFDGGSKQEIINTYFKDTTAGTGNESTLGIILYQFGYPFLIIFLIFQLSIIRKLIKMKYFNIAGFFIGQFIFFTLSESYVTLLLFIYPYILYRSIYIEYKNKFTNTKA